VRSGGAGGAGAAKLASSAKHAAISATKTKALSRLLVCCAASPARTPRDCNRVKASTTADATASSRSARAGTSSHVYSPITSATAAMLPALEIQSLQPTTKAGYSPSARRTKTYCPPERGSAAPSSASESAPSNAYTPPASHTARSSRRSAAAPRPRPACAGCRPDRVADDDRNAEGEPERAQEASLAVGMVGALGRHPCSWFGRQAPARRAEDRELGTAAVRESALVDRAGSGLPGRPWGTDSTNKQ